MNKLLIGKILKAGVVVENLIPDETQTTKRRLAELLNEQYCKVCAIQIQYRRLERKVRDGFDLNEKEKRFKKEAFKFLSEYGIGSGDELYRIQVQGFSSRERDAIALRDINFDGEDLMHAELMRAVRMILQAKQERV